MTRCAERDFALKVGPGLCLTPPMGWNSWNIHGSRVTDADVRAAADGMVASGLADHGWCYVNIDDGWEIKPSSGEKVRRDDGTIMPNEKSPDMRSLAGAQVWRLSAPIPKVWYNMLRQSTTTKEHSMRDLFVVGAGGFGREAIWTVERINSDAKLPVWNIIGYADDDPKWKKGDNYEGYPILGSVEEASRDYPGASVFVAIGNNAKRADIYKRLRGHDFPAIIDPKAQISPTTDFHHGTFIGAGAVVQVGTEIGKFSILGSNSVVGHDAVLGDFVNLGPGAVIASGVKVGNAASFFANSATMPWITIGEGASVSCGVGVKEDLPAGASV